MRLINLKLLPAVIIAALGLSVPLLALAQTAPNDRLWTEIEVVEEKGFFERMFDFTDQPEDAPRKYRKFRLDTDALGEIIATVKPFEDTSVTSKDVSRPMDDAPSMIAIPLPNGESVLFRIEPSDTMSPELMEQYPENLSFRGFSLDPDAGYSLRLDIAPSGFHAHVTGPDLNVVISPTDIDAYYLGSNKSYYSFVESDGPFITKTLGCSTEAINGGQSRPAPIPDISIGEELRVYRLAVATTAEYVDAIAGSKVKKEDEKKKLALAAVIRTINRVNQIYERDLAIRLELVGDNDKLISTDPAAFSNNNADKLLDESQITIDKIIGDDKYDVGHTFSTGAGGKAGLAVVGIKGEKARGVTGSQQPRGDPYDVDYVSHEIGHQFGANHTFNGALDACRSNRNGATAFEPGSGSTVMSYAGICDRDNLKNNSDDYFHNISLFEISNHINGKGETKNKKPSRNKPPEVEAGNNFVLPIATPFQLTASAQDDGAAARLTYSWEQMDLGPQSALNAVDDGDGPLVKSQKPQKSVMRSVPDIQNLLASGGTGLGEKLPSSERVSKFRITVRDHHIAGGAVASDSVELRFHNAAGPVTISVPSRSIKKGTKFEVTWDVANTAKKPISVDKVRILASADRGTTWPIILSAGTENDGSETVVYSGDKDRIMLKVQSVCNLFFAVSDELSVQ